MRLKVNRSHFNNENFCKDTKTFFLYALFAARNVYFLLYNTIKAKVFPESASKQKQRRCICIQVKKPLQTLDTDYWWFVKT